jgi:hypothetical protein
VVAADACFHSQLLTLDGERFTFTVLRSLLLRLSLDGPAFDRHDGKDPGKDEAHQSNSL